MRALGEQIAISEARVDRAKNESDEARAMLAETAQEMELIAFEKKQLLQQWKSSLVQLARRDEALAAAQKTLQAAQMEQQDIQTEIAGSKTARNSSRAPIPVILACGASARPPLDARRGIMVQLSPIHPRHQARGEDR